MKPAIIVSTDDSAGMNIRDTLVDLHGFNKTTETFRGNPVYMKDGIRMYTLDTPTIHSEGIDSEIDGDVIIFATRHRAASGKKSFSVHAPGNWSKAEAGGSDKKLCSTMPAMMKDAIKKINNTYGGDEFDIIQESTHHGPLIEKPCMFIEIGSTETEWVRRDCGEVIANVVNYIAINPIRKYKSVAVLGGGHYSRVATKLMLNTDYAVGHICPKHMLQNLDSELLQQIIHKNGNKFEMIVLDWKGLGPEKSRIISLLDDAGIKYERYQRLTKQDELLES